MTRNLTEALGRWLVEGVNQIGQVAILPDESGGFVLLHIDDVGRDGLSSYSTAADARAISTYDDAGGFRPLKTAPNLRHGWRLEVADVAALRAVLDAFYPAMLGCWFAQGRGELHPVDLRETLNRQSGMYAVTKKITDEQADALVGDFCRSAGGCLKTILWRISPERPVSMLPAEKFDPQTSQVPGRVPGGRPLPMLCSEACNLLVASAREVVKKAPSPAE